jgi:hypothetical protein
MHKAHFRLARCLCELRKYAEATKEMETYRDLVGGQPTPEETSLHARILNARNLRQVRYEINVFPEDEPPVVIVKLDMAPIKLCAPHPPEVPTRKYVASLVKKYDSGVRKSHKWSCWNCPARAVGLVHTPSSYLHLSDPQVIDFAQPVCVNGGACDKAARAMMDYEMRLATSVFGGNRS